MTGDTGKRRWMPLALGISVAINLAVVAAALLRTAPVEVPVVILEEVAAKAQVDSTEAEAVAGRILHLPQQIHQLAF